MSQVYEIPANDVISRQPGLVAPEYILLVRIGKFLEAIRADPEIVDQAIGGYDDEYVAAAKQLLARKSRPLPIYEGYPVAQEQLPGIGVVLRPANQGEKGIGGYWGEERLPTSLVEIRGSLWEAAVAIMCFGTSQREANTIGNIVAWILQIIEQDLEAVDGLVNATIMMTDPKPVEDDVLPRIQNVFSRVITYQCSYLNTVAREWRPLLRQVFGGAYDDRTTE